MTVQHLRTPPRLSVELARGGLGSLRKRGPYTGARLPETQLVLREAPVDEARMRAYARVCGFPAAGAGGGPQLPPTYPHILGFPLAMRLMAGRGFPFPVLGLVHTDIALTQRRPLRADERPEIAVYADGAAPHRRGTRFGMVTEARTDGELVWHSRSTYLCRHRTGPEAEPEQPSRERDSAPLPVRETWDLPPGLGRRYAAASGDRNPIHLHPLTARLFGFPRHIAHGMWTFARCLAAAGTAADGRLDVTARFTAPLPLPAAVTYGTSADGTAFEVRGDGERAARTHLTGTLHTGS
ncbi:MaoC/PaaZ C-terminal domain-containing protein [Streptomyces sp. HNM0574]|uniref:MaoC/PaaZ C-terminal domain-containing protein n=1 Tax=Streptomyces sp. HNM0574 TaxID=2714954 RepID=UPI00146E2A3E|nr:MaoC/PaaZ C-terminal domain-containing protein [Streptomyces sp. HNM0574]NLU70278.1 hypothetical protein [Streptomyces sp. HNM0574]